MDGIDRREALRRAAAVLGGALSSSLAAGVLAGCEACRQPAGTWRPRALRADQAELVATIAEHILPETDTPGARAVGVHQFIDALLAEAFPADERDRFVAGLAEVDRRARQSCGHAFLECAAAAQRTLLEKLASPPDPLSATRRGGTQDDLAVRFFRTLKQLTLVGYYTSEIGATRELHHTPVPGRYDGCVPLAQIGRTWAV